MAQIRINVDATTFKLADLKDHTERVSKVLELAREHNCTLVILPEFSFDESLRAVFSQYTDMTIFAGSHVDTDRMNRAVVLAEGKIHSYCKRNLSVFEQSVTFGQGLVAGDDPPLMLDIGGVRMAVLLCLDYLREWHSVARCPAGASDWADLIIAPSCNPKQEAFFLQAEAAHHQRSQMYSFLCNASMVTVGTKEIRCGKSAVFGFYNMDAADHPAPHLETMLSLVDSCDCVCEIGKIRLPPCQAPHQSMEYEANIWDVSRHPIQ